MISIEDKLITLLDKKFKQYNQPGFIENDPISIPHRFNKLQDIEIMAFWAAILSWGQRKTIIKSCNNLINMMDGAPYDFILNHKDRDLKPFLNFKHRTFNSTDALHFINFFKSFYRKNTSLETAFTKNIKSNDETIETGLTGFHDLFFSIEDAPQRTRKHIASPAKKSACKRICMFLRWMVRNDNKGVDLGLWKNIKSSQLICPLDVHVERVARNLGLIKRKQKDWKTALELTANLKLFDKNDPVKYDFALFGMGLEMKG